MGHKEKTREQLIEELERYEQRNAELQNQLEQAWNLFGEEHSVYFVLGPFLHETQNVFQSTAALLENLTYRENLPKSVRRDLDHHKHLVHRLFSSLGLLAQYLRKSEAQTTFVDSINSSVSLLRPNFENAGIKVKISLPDDFRIPVKPSMSVVILNILYNAIMALSDKGGDKAISITLSMIEADKKAQLDISDTGIGIQSTNIEHIFDVSYSAWTSHRINRHSAGIGLALSKHIVEQHGGEITVKSSFGVGTTFSIIIPLKVAEDL